MSNDRELLELAAKAAGIPLGVYEIHGCDDFGCKTGFRLKDNQNYIWNPKDDDGDALRLACDLGLRVYPIARTSSGAACSAVGSVTCERLSEVADLSLDTRAATRLAIVRAASEIGRAMP